MQRDHLYRDARRARVLHHSVRGGLGGAVCPHGSHVCNQYLNILY